MNSTLNRIIKKNKRKIIDLVLLLNEKYNKDDIEINEAIRREYV